MKGEHHNHPRSHIFTSFVPKDKGRDSSSFPWRFALLMISERTNPSQDFTQHSR